jgi:hypothetical protein
VISSRDTLLLSAQTTFRRGDIDRSTTDDLLRAFEYSAEAIWKRHIEDYRSLYSRLGLKLSPNSPNIPTDRSPKDSRDPGLIALYHNFSRYLLVSCSRDGHKALLANLQGIWNPSFHPPWGSKYTININIEMNYWSANAGNLSECEMPLFDHLERLAERGKATALQMYGCRGWACHHNTDIWADTDPRDICMTATLWPLGGAWLCTHIWDHYSFTNDRSFLHRMFPVLRGCVEFLLDSLIEDVCVWKVPCHYPITFA